MSRDSQAGLTLVEVLVVLTLVAILGGMTSLAIGSLRSGPTLERIAGTLATRITLAAEHAVTTGTDAALSLSSEGYRFRLLDGSEWVPHPIPQLGQVERLPNAVDIAGSERGILIPADATLAEPVRLDLSQSGRRIGISFDGLSAGIVSEGRT